MSAPDGRRISFAAAAGLAAAMGVGRFVFTPLLPIMVDAAQVTPSSGAVIATANYAGYLVGAVVLSLRPSINTTASFRLWTVVLVASQLGMAAVHSTSAFSVPRFLAGLANAARGVLPRGVRLRHRRHISRGGSRRSRQHDGGPVVWIGVGLAAVPATVLWQDVARRTSMRNALVAAFALQSIAALLPALTGNTVAAVLSALLFGGTFMGITMLTLSIGRDAATLTAIYGVGPVLGPLIVTPAIGDSYSVAVAIATAVLVLGLPVQCEYRSCPGHCEQRGP